MNTTYSFVNQDNGYEQLQQNQWIMRKFPYKNDIEPRLVHYLRTYYFHKINNVKPCVPLIMTFWIKYDDIEPINRYLHKYSIVL